MTLCASVLLAGGVRQSSVLTLSAGLDENWRGAYDLLITAGPDSLNRCVENESSRVAANFASGGEGGLSMVDVEAMRALSGVEVAAPIGLVGEYTGNAQYVAMLFPDPLNEGSDSWVGYEVMATLAADTGAEVVRVAQAQTRMMQGGLDGYIVAENAGRQPGQFSTAAIVGVPALTQSIVAVDPEAEMALLGESGGFLRPLRRVAEIRRDAGRDVMPGAFYDSMAPPQEVLRGGEDLLGDIPRPPGQEPSLTESPTDDEVLAQSLPVVINTDPQFRLELELGVRELETAGISAGLMVEDMGRAVDDAAAGEALPGQVAVFSEELRPFSMAELTVPAWWLETEMVEVPAAGSIATVGRGIPSPLQLEGDGCVLQAVPAGLVVEAGPRLGVTVQQGTPQQTYRRVETVEVDTPVPVPVVIGEYSSSDVDAGTDRVSYVPLGAYEPGLTEISDPEREGVETGSMLRPAMHGRGISVASAAGITDMRGARDMIGRDAVDAVRVRVAGLTGYDAAGREKVVAVAQEIQALGFHVDVVAGSSREDTQIEVSAYYVTQDRDDPPALGTVTQQWSTLGAATRVESSMDRVGQVLLVIAVGAASLMTVALAGFAGVARRGEVVVHQTMGWTRAESTRFLGGELVVGFVVLAAAGAAALWVFDDAPALRATLASAGAAYLVGAGLLLALAQPRQTTRPSAGQARGRRSGRRAAPSFGVAGFAVRRMRHDAVTHGLLAVAAAGAGAAAGGCVLAILRARSAAGETMLSVLMRDTLLPLHLGLGGVGLLSCVVLAVVSRRVQLAASRPAERALVTGGWGRTDVMRMWSIQALMVGAVALVLALAAGLLVARQAPQSPLLVLAATVAATLLVVGASWVGQRRTWRSMT